MGKIYSGEKIFFPLKSFENVEGSYGNQTIKFPAKILRKVFAHSPKVQKYRKRWKFQKRFSSKKIIWTRRIRFRQPYRKVFSTKPTVFIAWNPWLWRPDFKHKILPKPAFGNAKFIIDNPTERYSLKLRKLLLGVRERWRTIHFQKNFPGNLPLDT